MKSPCRWMKDYYVEKRAREENKDQAEILESLLNEWYEIELQRLHESYLSGDITPDRVITIRPITRNRKEICCSMDARREKLREQYGLMDDSSKIIYEFRDSR